jgi:hypothetical protein
MQISRRNIFTTIKTEGGLLPADLLVRIAEGDPAVDGLTPEAYHLAKSERLNEAANRAWNRLKGAWEGFKAASQALPEADAGTTLTRERWLLILFQEFGYGRLTTRRAYEVEGKTYPVSHEWQNTPIHLVSFRQELDRRTPGARGASRVSPHSLLQELLNRGENLLWGLVSNGLVLRLLRDNVSLTRQAYVEFDLQAMMDSEAYSDFFLLFLLCHQSRVEVPEGKTPEHCWLERWYNSSLREGTRVLDRLRDGVEQAIQALGGGFLAHAANQALRDRLRSGDLTTQDYYRQVLRVVYRLLFLFVAEDRDLLLLPAGGDPALAAGRELYIRYYSTQRLRRLAERRRSARHADLYRALQLVFAKLHTGCPELALPALGSFLFSPQSTPDLSDADIANADLLEAVRNLTFTTEGNVRRWVDYRNLGPEELGSVYESLLEMHPDVNLDAGRFTLTVAAGSERKTSGSYYTPTSLVNCLLDSALDPVLDEACKKPEPDKALLDLKICDPACGSGHFLIAAAHRIAKRLAAIRAGEDEPSPLGYQHALRDVIGRCIYGVDINPDAVELCKINLWMEALEPGKPLTFLDHHIRCGNSLLGATPALLAQGIPDEAFKPIEGDHRAYCTELRRQNRGEREDAARGQGALFWPWERLGDLASAMVNLDEMPDDTPQAVQAKQERYEQLVKSSGYLFGRLWADAWCAAFVWRKVRERDGGPPYAITEQVFRAIERNPHSAPQWMKDEIQRLARQYQFFHWHLEFPDVFRPAEQRMANGERRMEGKAEESSTVAPLATCQSPIAASPQGWLGGFDCVLGNPPWEAVNADPVEFFAAVCPEISGADNQAERELLIDALKSTNPDMYALWSSHLRSQQAYQSMVKDSGRFPLGSYGKTNTFPLFTELGTQIMASHGRCGIIVKTAIATDHDYNPLFSWLMRNRRVHALVDFENKEGLFPAVHQMERFCLLTLVGGAAQAQEVVVAFNLHSLDQVRTNALRVSVRQIDHLTGGTFQFPAIRCSQDLHLLTVVSTRESICALNDPSGEWGADFAIIYDGGQVSSIGLTLEDIADGEESTILPVYEGKLIAHFNHRSATYEGIPRSHRFGKTPAVRDLASVDLLNPNRRVVPRYWVTQLQGASRLADKGIGVKWSLMYGRKASANNARSIIAAICPGPISNDTVPLLFFPDVVRPDAATRTLALCGVLCSFAFDYMARIRVVGTTFGKNLIMQMPVPTLTELRRSGLGQGWGAFIWLRALELTYTAWDLECLAQDLGYEGPPFKWDDERRFLIRCELDAAFFCLYLGNEQEWKQNGSKELLAYFPTPHHAVEYIMDTFRILRERDEAAHGTYRTKDTILEIYDEMQAVMAENAVAAGRQPTARYQTRLNPPPGPPCDAAGNFIPMAQWDPAHWPSHIHQPREAVVAVPEEVPVAEFAAMTYPATDADKAICAAALAVVEQSAGISSMEHLDALLLATHPDWCKAFLDRRGQAAFETARKSAPAALFVGQGQSIRWKECRDYLEQLNALTVAHGDKGQPIGVGTAIAPAKAGLPTGVDGVVECALMALARIRELRKDLSSVPQAQRVILDALEEQHLLCGLAA